jgi:hypothetical protein
MPIRRHQEFECLGIPLKANVFATLRPRALSAPCTDNPTKKFPGNQGIVSIWRLLFDVDLGPWREEPQDEYKYQDSGCDLLIIDCMEIRPKFSRMRRWQAQDVLVQARPLAAR